MSQRASDFEDRPGGSAAGVFPSFREWRLHALLLVLTLATTTFFGGLFGRYSEEDLRDQAAQASPLAFVTGSPFLLEGLRFSIPLLLILASHEMGHYLACRKHGLAASLPYFLPAPFGIGTMGAIIRIREPVRSKRQLLEIGAAGPIAGFLVLVPFLLYGVAQANVIKMPVGDLGPVWIFGEPLLYKAAMLLVGPNLVEGTTIELHPCAWAAWFGMLITLLNLLPLAQLDGGHITYALTGRRHHSTAWWLLLALVGLGFLWGGWWLWVAIILILGVEHPPVPDEALPPTRQQLLIGLAALLIFVLCFTPSPIMMME